MTVIGISNLSTGGVAGTVIDPKIVFITALKANASSIILAHNHPSGNLSASRADKEVTEQIKSGGQLLEIQLADHIILSKEGLYSFSENVTYGMTKNGSAMEFEVMIPF